MADVIHKTTFQYLTSVNTPNYPSENWLINPDISGVSGVPQKHWKVIADGTSHIVVEMNQAEKDVVDYVDPVYIEDITESCTTMLSWQDKLTITTGAKFSGTYNISWNFKLWASVVHQSVEARLYNITDDEEYGLLNIHQDNPDERISIAGFHRFEFNGGAKTFIVQWRAKSDNVTANISDVSISIGGPS